MPGGLGTLDELFEALTLIQTGKIRNFPVVLMGVDYWAPLRAQLDVMVREQTIDRRDLDLLLVTDDVEAALTPHQRPDGEAVRADRPPGPPAREGAGRIRLEEHGVSVALAYRQGEGHSPRRSPTQP